MKLDERTGKIMELDDTSTERLEDPVQDPPPLSNVVETTPLEESDELMNFANVEVKPVFPGCEEHSTEDERFMCFNQSIMKHVGENFEFPRRAIENGIEGKVYVNFVIEKDGKSVL